MKPVGLGNTRILIGYAQIYPGTLFLDRILLKSLPTTFSFMLALVLSLWM